MDIVIDIAPTVEDDLVLLEADQPGLREGYDHLKKWLSEDYKVGKLFNFSESDPREIRSTEVHAVDVAGIGKSGENVAMLVYEVWRDHAIHVQPLGVFRWSDWQGRSHEEREAVIRQRLG